MNWSSDEIIKISYRLLGVNGYGIVQTNKILSSLKPCVTTSQQLEDSIERLLKPSELQIFQKDALLYQRAENVRYVSMLDDERYPADLRLMLRQQTPTVLSYIGNWSLLCKKKAAFSGSRKASEKGLWITRDCVTQLASNDICIVSGYASGVDMAAHTAALQSGGSTIIVLPEGIKYFYIKKELKEIWDWNRVLVISEFLPHEKWMTSRAMKRNQTMIGLSDVVVVVEAGESGGSYDAGLKSIEAGKSLFVPVFKSTPESALGNSILIRKGAKSLYMRKETQHANTDAIHETIVKKVSTELFV